MRYYADLKVQANCHIELRSNKTTHFYSVPYIHVGKQTRVVYTRSWINIYVDNKQVASHLREYGYGFTTVKEHMASNCRIIMECSAAYYIEKTKWISADCHEYVKVMYFTTNMLIENHKLVHMEGRETNFFRKLNNQDVLIVADFGMVKLDGQIQHDFEQIIDDRYNRKALILSSQLPVADWYNVFQSELIAEACLDRLVHKAIKFDLKGESLRKKY